MNQQELIKVLEILKKDSRLISDVVQFSDYLGTPTSVSAPIMKGFRNNTVSVHELFKELLEDWIEREGPKATIANLRLVMEEIEFLACSEKLRVLSITLAKSNSTHSGCPRVEEKVQLSDKRVSNKIKSILGEYGPSIDWKRLANEFCISNEIFENAMQGKNTSYSKADAIIDCWHVANPEEATAELLIKILEDVGLKAPAEEIKKLLKK